MNGLNRFFSQMKFPGLFPKLGMIILILLYLAFPAFSGTTGKIAGTVIDANTGEPLAGVNVFLEGTSYGASTDEDGYYFIVNVPPGNYNVVAQYIGYAEYKKTNVRISVDLTTKIHFKLKEEMIQGETIVVTAERPLVEKDLTSTAANIHSEEIKAMPVENFHEVVELQAGVVAGHFRGGRAGEVAYLVDGIPVNDPFNNGISLELENSSVQQLEVISGTFNAEYGQAMSGIVNTVTREGGEKYEVEYSSYFGNYFTNHNKIFPNLNQFKMNGIQNYQLTLSGPLPLYKKLKFFATTRKVSDDGAIYGPHLYDVTDNDAYHPSGDSTFVPLNSSDHLSFHGKITYPVTPTLKINYGLMYNDNENSYYNHSFRLVPDATKTHYRNSIYHNLIIDHTVSATTFYTLKFAKNFSEYQGYVYKNPFDSLYFSANNGQPRSSNTFRSGGLESDRYKRKTTTWLMKWDLTSQVNKIHKVGVGFQVQRHYIDNFWTDLDIANTSQFSGLVYPDEFSPGTEKYYKEPTDFSAYIQDKIEYNDFIINAGVRFDYFDPNTKVPTDLKNPELLNAWNTGLRSIKAKSQFSPRLGVAFPISSEGVIHVSYGHFFQIPQYEQLYQGITDSANVTKYYLPFSDNLSSLKGNPDLKAQRTTKYEMGIQQALNEEMVIDFTAYYSDIRNLVGSEIIETYNNKKYARYVNRDYGNVKGVILSLEKRFQGGWGARIDYTYQVAEGNASDPRAVFFDNQADPPREPEKKIISLDWDQRSTLNMAFNTGKPGNWNVSVIGRYGSGSPYTASSRYILANVTFRNNRVKPYVLSFDLRAEKNFKLKNADMKLFLWVENLFDRLNEYNVYGSTGHADNDLDISSDAGAIYGLHTRQDYITNPGFYSAPRQIRLGFSLGL